MTYEKWFGGYEITAFLTLKDAYRAGKAQGQRDMLEKVRNEVAALSCVPALVRSHGFTTEYMKSREVFIELDQLEKEINDGRS